jgi:predicted O-methyltransferase YrrM
MNRGLTGGDAWKAYHDFFSMCDTSRFQKLFARMEVFRLVADSPGDIVDAGAYKGVSTILFAHMLKAYRPHSLSRVLCCDTFAPTFPHALPEEASGVAQLAADYDPMAHENLVAALDRLGLSDRVEILKGDIVETLPRYVEANPGFRVSLLHCDLDAYTPTLATLRAIWPRIVGGGVALFDEYAVRNWGESKAVDEFLDTLAPRPRLKALAVGPTPTAYCIKE